MTRPTNNAGGLEGGVTNGEDLRITGYMKPIATLMKPLRSIDLTTLEESPAAIERSDVCAVPAAAVVAEAMVAFVLADAAIEKFGGDSMTELIANWQAFRAAHVCSLRTAIMHGQPSRDQRRDRWSSQSAEIAIQRVASRYARRFAWIRATAQSAAQLAYPYGSGEGAAQRADKNVIAAALTVHRELEVQGSLESIL